MRPIRYIMFLEAVIVILLHALIPHVHHGEITFEAHVKAHAKAHTIFEILELKFHKHLSVDLTNYTLAQSVALKKVPINKGVPSYSFTNQYSTQVLKLYFHTWTFRYIALSKELHLESSGLRGPPADNYIS